MARSGAAYQRAKNVGRGGGWITLTETSIQKIKHDQVRKNCPMRARGVGFPTPILKMITGAHAVIQSLLGGRGGKSHQVNEKRGFDSHRLALLLLPRISSRSEMV